MSTATHVVSTTHNPQLITADVDFDVIKRPLFTDNNMKMPEHVATIRVDKNGVEKILGCVGTRYELVDHKDVISDFAQVLQQAGLTTATRHDVFGDGARVYSRFTLDEDVDIALENGKTLVAHPFLTLANSYDGSLKVGFLTGAVINKVSFYASPKLHEVKAKHLMGVSLEKVLEEVKKAMQVLTDEVIPLWKNMMITKLSLEQATQIMETAVGKHIIAKRRADTLPLGTHTTVWELFSDFVKTLGEPSARGTEESGITRSANGFDFFVDQLKAMGIA